MAGWMNECKVWQDARFPWGQEACLPHAPWENTMSSRSVPTEVLELV